MKREKMPEGKNITPLLKKLSVMDQATTEREQRKAEPDLLREIATYAEAENIILYRKTEDDLERYIPVADWSRQGMKDYRISEIMLTDYPVLRGCLNKKEVFKFSQSEQNKDTKEYALLSKTELQSIMFIPILAFKQLCGFLKIDNFPTTFSEDDLEILKSIASHWGAIHAGMKMIASETEKNNKLEEVLSEEKNHSDVMSALSKIYWQIYSVDLEKKIYREVFDGKIFDRNAAWTVGIDASLFQDTVDKFVSDEYKSTMCEFLDHETLQERLKKTETIFVEYLSKDDIWLSARYIVKKRDISGKVTHALFTIRSINEHKQKEKQYQKKLEEIAEEAKRANIAKTDFLRRMSHDLRTPINGIRGMLEISERNAHNFEKLKDCRKKIWDASEYLLNLINDVLDMNRLESGKLSLEQQSFDMREIWRDLDDVIGIQANEKGIALVTGVHRVEHTKLIGSPLYLRQILMNIGNNAVKYTKAGGTITISCIETRIADDESVYKFVVADTGIGMSIEFQKHAYEVFTQENSQVSGGYVGTGLGLSITKQLVDLLKGTIEFTSKPGEGTTFIIELPFKIDYSKIDHIEESGIEKIDLTGKKFLLVEDNELNMEICKYILEEEGANVDVASDGKQAVEMFSKSQEKEYALILMDIMMPVMNGYEATRLIRKMNRKDAQTVPIFAMSANAFPEDIKESVRAGMNQHLSKPLETDVLLRAIYNTISNERSD